MNFQMASFQTMPTLVGKVSKERLTRWAKPYGFVIVKDNSQQYQLKLTMVDEKDHKDKNVFVNIYKSKSLVRVQRKGDQAVRIVRARARVYNCIITAQD